MKEYKENWNLTPLASFVQWFLKLNNIDIKKSIYTEKTFFWNNDYHYYLYLDKEIDIKNIYDIFKNKLNQDEINQNEFIKLRDNNTIIIGNLEERVVIMNYKLSFLEKIKENLIKLFK